jgi:hypothetical protein
MSKVLILAAMAAVSLACHNRAEDEVGAAPEQGDTTAVTHAIDSTRTGPPGVGGRPGNATVTADSVGADSALTNQENPGTPGQNTDSTGAWSSTPQDTLGPRNPNQPAYGDTTGADTGVQDTTSMQQDTTSMQGDSMQHGDSTMMHGDSALTEHEVPDTTTAR